MEFHYERIVRAKRTKKQKIMAILIFLVSIVMFPVIAMVLGVYLKLYGVGLAVICLLAWLVYVFLTRMDIEYEYQLTAAVGDTELEITKIINKKKRKVLFLGSCKDFEIVAKYNGSKDGNAYRNMVNKIEAVRSMEEPDIFFLVTNTEKGRTLIYFQVNEEMAEGIRKTIPSRFFES